MILSMPLSLTSTCARRIERHEVRVRAGLGRARARPHVLPEVRSGREPAVRADRQHRDIARLVVRDQQEAAARIGGQVTRIAAARRLAAGPLERARLLIDDERNHRSALLALVLLGLADREQIPLSRIEGQERGVGLLGSMQQGQPSARALIAVDVDARGATGPGVRADIDQIWWHEAPRARDYPNAAGLRAGPPPGTIASVSAGVAVGQTEPRPGLLHLLGQWHGLFHDHERLALRRGLRAALVVTIAFGVLTVLNADVQLSTFVNFGLIALLILADFGGPMPTRARAYVLTWLIGCLAIVVASLVSRDILLSALAMALFRVRRHLRGISAATWSRRAPRCCCRSSWP